MFEALLNLDLSLLAEVNILGQKIASSDLAVIGLLILLEGVLSIDNALVLGILAKRLPAHQRPRALSYGLIGAFVFRVIAICTASILLRWTFVKFLGGAYLAYISLKHLVFDAKDHSHDNELKLDEHGHPVIADEEDVEAAAAQRKNAPSFWGTVAVIELTDVAFAVDSILAAMALAGSKQEKLWVVITGGILGVILMRFAAAIFIKLLVKFPRFETTAYLLVLVIGVKLLADWGANSDWSCDRPAWLAKGLGDWKPKMEKFEEQRVNLVHDYENWLEKSWIFKIKPHTKIEEDVAVKAVEKVAPEAVAETKQGEELDIPHTPHLLDFHDLRRPECMTFWILMAAFLGFGFLPESKKKK